MERQPVRVLGVDPGTRVAGFGVLDVLPGGRFELVDCGPIHLPVASKMAERLRVLHERLRAIVDLHSPQALAVETVFHGKSFQSVLKVGEARGVVLLLGAVAGLDIEEFSPAMVKKMATGNGRATKAQVQKMIQRLLELDEAPEPLDVSDALAIAFCYGRRLWRRSGGGETCRLEELARETRAQKKETWRELVRSAEAAARRRK